MQVLFESVHPPYGRAARLDRATLARARRARRLHPIVRRQLPATRARWTAASNPRRSVRCLGISRRKVEAQIPASSARPTHGQEAGMPAGARAARTAAVAPSTAIDTRDPRRPTEVFGL